jgi:hypothetical protein
LTDLFEQRVEIFRAVETDDALPVVACVDDFGAQAAFAERDFLPAREPARRTRERLPYLRLTLREQKQFDLAARRLAPPDEPRRKDARVVDD